MESRTQGSRPRTQKKSEAKAKDSLSEDRHSRGQGQECSRPRSRTKDTKRKCSPKKKKKRSSQKFFRCPRAEDRPIFKDLRPRGQGQGLDLPRPRPRTSKSVLEDSTSGYKDQFLFTLFCISYSECSFIIKLNNWHLLKILFRLDVAISKQVRQCTSNLLNGY